MARFSFSGPVCNRDRIVKVLVAGLGILICTASGQAKAAPVTFDALGVFDGGTIMHGTITIDTATGKAVWADLVIYRAGQELQFYGKPTTTVAPGTWRSQLTRLLGTTTSAMPSTSSFRRNH